MMTKDIIQIKCLYFKRDLKYSLFWYIIFFGFQQPKEALEELNNGRKIRGGVVF